MLQNQIINQINKLFKKYYKWTNKIRREIVNYKINQIKIIKNNNNNNLWEFL